MLGFCCFRGLRMLLKNESAARSERIPVLLPDATSLAAAFAALPEWRRRKAEELRFEADRRRSVAAWMLLRQVLAEKGLDADSLPVTENEFGKPAFDPSLGIHFNLSHAGERVMVAVSDLPVGCDVERIVPIDDEMLKAGLADLERTRLAALSGEARDRAFIRLWVRKESYVKAVGRGMDIDFSTFSALDAPPSTDWSWQDFDYGDGHLGCVCICSMAQDLVSFLP